MLLTILTRIGTTVVSSKRPNNNKTVGICVSKENTNKMDDIRQARFLVAYKAESKHSIKSRSQAIILEYHIAEKFNKFNAMPDIWNTFERVDDCLSSMIDVSRNIQRIRLHKERNIRYTPRFVMRIRKRKQVWIVNRLLTIENKIINWNKRINTYSDLGKCWAKLKYLDCCKMSVHNVVFSNLIVDVVICSRKHT